MTDDLFDVEELTQPTASKAKKDASNEELRTIVLRIHVQPGPGRATVVGRQGNALHIRVAPPPFDPRSNAAATIDLVGEILDVEPSMIEVVQGVKGREKQLRIRGVDPTEVQQRLDTTIAVNSGKSPGRPANRRVGR